MDMVVELRKLEGINTSFDYGVEIVVMAVKRDPTLENFYEIVDAVADKVRGVFDFDIVVKKGFDVAYEFVGDYIEFMSKYYVFIREFKHDPDVYACLSEPKIIVFSSTRGELWKQRQIDEMKDTIEYNGFNYKINELSDGNVEFRVMPKA